MSERNDELFEILLKEAVSDNIESQIKEIDSDKTEIEFSKEHNKIMKKLFKIPIYKKVSFKKNVKNIAVFFISFCIIFALILSVSPDARAFVKKVIFSWTESVAVFSQSPENAKEETVLISEEKGVKWEPAFLPEGYEADLAEYSDIGFIMYTKGNDSIIFEYAKTDSASFINNEDVTFDTFSENEVDYYIFVSDENSGKDNVIVWENEGYRFSLNSLEDIEVLKTMALSVNKN